MLSETVSGKQRRKRGKRKGKGKAKDGAWQPPQPKKTAAERREAKAYARRHGAERGSLKNQDAVPPGVETPLNLVADDEGLCAFVQTTQCRQKIWAEVFDNDPENLRKSHQNLVRNTLYLLMSTWTAPRPVGVLCCDNCHPQLLDRTRPGRPPAADKQSLPKKGELDEATRDRLELWRDELYDDAFSDSFLPPSAVLDDETVELLACYGRLAYEELEVLLEPRWLWWSAYQWRLYNLVKTLPERKVTQAGSRQTKGGATQPRDKEGWNVRFAEPQVNDCTSGPAQPEDAIDASTSTSASNSTTPYLDIAFSQVSFSGTKMVAEKIKRPKSTPSKAPRKKKARLDSTTSDAPAASQLAHSQAAGTYIPPSSHVPSHYPKPRPRKAKVQMAPAAEPSFEPSGFMAATSQLDGPSSGPVASSFGQNMPMVAMSSVYGPEEDVFLHPRAQAFSWASTATTATHHNALASSSSHHLIQAPLRHTERDGDEIYLPGTAEGSSGCSTTGQHQDWQVEQEPLAQGAAPSDMG